VERTQEPELPLSPLEAALLKGLADGLSMNAVARHCGLSTRTLRRHMRTLCDRIEVRSPIQAVAWAARRGLV
jgi:DNA-binding NarL/FixJ family response regulator